MTDSERLQKALSMSEFVKTPEDLYHAVRAADDMWKVVNGVLPARKLLSGLKGVNLLAFWTIVQDLAQYIERETNQKMVPADPTLGPVVQPQANPRDIAISVVSNWTKGTFAEGNEPQLLHRCASKLGEPEADLIARIFAGNLEGLEAAYSEVMKDERRRMA